MTISLQRWLEWAMEYTVLPYVQAYKLDSAAVPTWEPFWEQSSAYAIVLESGNTGRYSYFAGNPLSVIQGKGLHSQIDFLRENRMRKEQGKPLEQIRAWMGEYTAPSETGYPFWTGGCAGYLGYDVVRSIERLPEMADDDLALPDYFMMMIDELYILDRQEKTLYCAVSSFHKRAAEESALSALYSQAQVRADRMKRQWDKWVDAACRQSEAFDRERQYRREAAGEEMDFSPAAFHGINASLSESEFVAAVTRIQEYIRQGDCFQVNLSVRQSAPLDAAPERIYEWLRILNPSPYMGCLKLPQQFIVSASPELLIKLDQRKMTTRPIAGTRRRGKNQAEDRELSGKLLANEKEKAEHVMLVDLERNDFGKISRFGTVRVSEFMALEYYSHVMHIVSEVKGELAPGKDAFDAIAAVFPGGTITGAPKIRTMEIIEELEPVRRGLYTGSIGWIDYNGNMELNIVIRTLLACEGTAHVQAGAGIVIDSLPAMEYQESLNKAKALWKALKYAQRERQ